MPADDDERTRHVAFDPLRQSNRAIALRREVALQADDVGIELLACRQSRFFAVDAKIVDGALVAVRFEAGGDADRAERLDERQHFQSEDAADGRFDECDFHGCRQTVTRVGSIVIPLLLRCMAA